MLLHKKACMQLLMLRVGHQNHQLDANGQMLP
jgi:hypothetical protein